MIRRSRAFMSRTLRTQRFGLVLSEPEREGLRCLAEIEGLAESDVIRRMLRLAINELPESYKQAINWSTVPSRLQDNGISIQRP